MAMLLTSLLGCTEAELGYPWLHELDAGPGVKASGAKLMALPEGVHSLEPAGQENELLVVVHGFRSEGYEWVHLLQTLDNESTHVAFFRWDYRGCPGPAAESLVQAVRALAAPQIDRVRLFGHSYGGLVVAELIDSWPLAQPLEAHIVASPLRGSGNLTERCGYASPAAASANVSVFEWRTVQSQDGAFRDLPEDPQEVEIAGSTVTRLPLEYQGHRLGHNRSLSWVADTVARSGNPGSR